jgi:hypothetical protein
LKSQALKVQGAFDRAAAELWVRKSKQSGYDYNDFGLDKEFLALQKDYEGTLKEMRQNNLDILSPKKKEKEPATTAPSAPASSSPKQSAPATTPQSNNVESPLEKFKREKAERDKKAQGNS